MIMKAVFPDGTEIQQILVYSEPELAEALKTNVRLIGLLRRLGALQGTYLGNKYIYTVDAVEDFLERYQGCDLTNESTILEAVRFYGSLSLPNKKGLPDAATSKKSRSNQKYQR